MTADFFLNQVLSPSSALFVALSWAIGGTIYARLSANYSPWAVNFARGIIGPPFFIVISFFEIYFFPSSVEGSWGQLTFDKTFWLTLSIIGTVGFGDALYLLSTRALGVPLSMVVCSLYPIWSGIFAWSYLNQKLNIFQTIGVVATVFGVAALIIFREKISLSLTRDKKKFINYLPVGIALAIATSFFWALGTFALAKGGTGLSPFVGSAVRLTIGAAMCPLVGMLFVTPRNKLFLPKEEWIKNLPILFLEGVLNGLAWTFCLTHGSLAVAAALSSTSPLFAALFSWFKGYEKFSIPKLFALIIVTLGIILLSVSGFL